ncbi:MAG: GNAT family N-acetyltransferase, partial [Pseudomonadota bacterium]
MGTQGTAQPVEAARRRAVDERAGSLQVRVAESEAEIEAAYALRYAVFYDEMHAKAVGDVAARKRDFDAFDPYCDHLLVLDNDLGGGADAVVGTYRLLRRDGAEKAGQFYSDD